MSAQKMSGVKRMELLRKKVSCFIREHALCMPGGTLVVAFSGGADSAALLDILAHLPGFDLQLVVAHLNHQLRGAESDADELFVRETAGRYACPFVSSRVDVAALAGERGLSLEEAGREARYAFLRDVAVNHAAAAVAVGHHKGDQAETVLMRLLRGAGGSGLSGMRPKSPAGVIVRPLLFLSRAEIEAYLLKGGLKWREDGSNADTGFLRNRIRHELLPYLEEYSPDIASRLCQTAETLAADEDFIEKAAAGLFARAVTATPGGAEADIEVIYQEPPALRKRLYRQAIQTVKGDLRQISFTHLQAVDRLIFAERPNSELILPGGIRVERAYRRLLITSQPDESLPADYEQVIVSPGLFSLPCGGSLLVERLEGPETARTAAAPGEPTVFAGQLQFPWTVRYYRNGDRFIPAGMCGHKKLKDLFVDRKIPLKARRRIPLLVAGGEIVWVCGVQLSAKTKDAAAGSGLARHVITYTAAAERY
jgi:tRNA(Ile)-lysidine synthase